MAPTSFPGVSSSPPPSNSNNDNDNTEDKMEDYERRWRERNSEETHKTALAAALARHNEIRERALGILEIEQLREETEMLRQKRIQTEERVKLETQRAMEQLRIREEENKARQIPQPPPRVPTPPPAIPASISQPKQPDNAPTPASQQVKQPPPAPAPLQHPSSNAPRTSQTKDTPQSTFQQHLNQLNAFQPTQNQHLASQPSKIQPAISNAMQKQTEAPAKQPNQNPQLAQAPVTATTGPQHPQNLSHTPQAGETSSTQTRKPHTLHESVDRYLTIHKNLKEVRQAIKERGEKDAQFKKKAGEMRRAITRSVGQLTGERGANKVPTETIVAQLEASLGISTVHEAVHSQPYPPELVLASKPERGPQGTLNNGEHMPLLTIYLLNILAKSAIAQFCSEAGANPITADPIGVILVFVFAQRRFSWRGRSLIDIVIAKFRVLCPVLFGVRGSDKTEEGRAKLGWKKDQNGTWISEQEHNDRMTGLGAGYASICLRDFSKSQLFNPWPATNYWFSLASITCTRPDDTSSTQFVVLKAMIDNHTAKFLRIYGDMGVRALHVALEDFPHKAAAGNVAASSLQVLAAKLRRDTGLTLEVI